MVETCLASRIERVEQERKEEEEEKGKKEMPRGRATSVSESHKGATRPSQGDAWTAICHSAPQRAWVGGWAGAMVSGSVRKGVDAMMGQSG
jgi:hypothetical protein